MVFRNVSQELGFLSERASLRDAFAGIHLAAGLPPWPLQFTRPKIPTFTIPLVEIAIIGNCSSATF